MRRSWKRFMSDRDAAGHDPLLVGGGRFEPGEAAGRHRRGDEAHQDTGDDGRPRLAGVATIMNWGRTQEM